MAQAWWPDGLPPVSDDDCEPAPADGPAPRARGAKRRRPGRARASKRPCVQHGLPVVSSDDDGQFGQVGALASADVPGPSADSPGDRSAAGGAAVGQMFASSHGEGVSAVVSGDHVASTDEAGGPRLVGGARNSAANVNRQWKEDVALVDGAVAEWVRSREIPWVETVKAVLGPQLIALHPRVATDCEGIGAPCEAMRIMEHGGAMGKYHHVMSCEIDDDARSWFLRHHGWPDTLFRDMLERTWPDGVCTDLLTNSPSPLPQDCDIYVCGFPCQPFSGRHGKSALFEEVKVRSSNISMSPLPPPSPPANLKRHPQGSPDPKLCSHVGGRYVKINLAARPQMSRLTLPAQAQPFFAVVKTLCRIRPRCAILENVEGLERRYVVVDGERITCLVFILRFLRQEVPGFYFCAAPPRLTCPTSSGYRMRRPREYILAGRSDAYPEFPTEEAFAQAATRTFTDLVQANAARMASADRQGSGSAPASSTTPPTDTVDTSAFCACSWRSPCERHPCRCGCRGDSSKCCWRKRHGPAWAKLPKPLQHYSYFQDLWATFRIDADKLVTSPRARDLLSLKVAEHGGVAACLEAMLDLSQSYGWDQWRSDGHIPTLATNSSIFLVGSGRFFEPKALFAEMGFPEALLYSEFPARTLCALLGNTMHVGVVGFAVATMLALQGS